MATMILTNKTVSYTSKTDTFVRHSAPLLFNEEGGAVLYAKEVVIET